MRKFLISLGLAGTSAIGLAPTTDAALPNCGPVTYAWGSKNVSCNLQPPDILHILGVTRAQCDQYGGVWGGYIKLKDGGTTTICRYADY